MLICDALDLREGSFELMADLRFPAEAITALIGPSGAGKSTLLAAIAGFVKPFAGRVLWYDTDLTMLHPGARPISILFQDNNLFAHLTVAQNVGLGVRADLRLAPKDRQAVASALAAVGLQGFEARKPGTLSGGQQSRVTLARVLVADRPVVLLDEPFAALGPALKAEMLDLVRDQLLAAGKTVIMVTHDPDDARRIADKVAIVADARVAEPMATDALLDNPPPALAAYLG